MNYSQELVKELQLKAIQVRANILEMIPPGKVGHLGGSSSIADVMAALYFHTMKVNKDDPKDPSRDRLIMSKGHAVLVQYACLAELGYFDRSELGKVKTFEGILQGHPDMDKTPGIEAVTGSLGQGLSVSLGVALGLALDKSESRVYTILGDGELAEGTGVGGRDGSLGVQGEQPYRIRGLERRAGDQHDRRDLPDREPGGEVEGVRLECH